MKPPVCQLAGYERAKKRMRNVVVSRGTGLEGVHIVHVLQWLDVGCLPLKERHHALPIQDVEAAAKAQPDDSGQMCVSGRLQARIYEEGGTFGLVKVIAHARDIVDRLSRGFEGLPLGYNLEVVFQPEVGAQVEASTDAAAESWLLVAELLCKGRVEAGICVGGWLLTPSCSQEADKH